MTNTELWTRELIGLYTRALLSSVKTANLASRRIGFFFALHGTFKLVIILNISQNHFTPEFSFKFEYCTCWNAFKDYTPGCQSKTKYSNWIQMRNLMMSKVDCQTTSWRQMVTSPWWLWIQSSTSKTLLFLNIWQTSHQRFKNRVLSPSFNPLLSSPLFSPFLSPHLLSVHVHRSRSAGWLLNSRAVCFLGCPAPLLTQLYQKAQEPHILCGFVWGVGWGAVEAQRDLGVGWMKWFSMLRVDSSPCGIFPMCSRAVWSLPLLCQHSYTSVRLAVAPSPSLARVLFGCMPFKRWRPSLSQCWNDGREK